MSYWPPFDQDAMEDTFLSPEALTESACFISNQFDIPLSATFNNIWVRPDQKNLDLWIKEFAPIYNGGKSGDFATYNMGVNRTD